LIATEIMATQKSPKTVQPSIFLVSQRLMTKLQLVHHY